MSGFKAPSDWRPLALSLALLLAGYAVIFRLMPFESRAWALWPFSALPLFCGARLSIRWSLPLVLCVILLSDLLLFQWGRIPPNYLFYLVMGLTVLLGRFLLARSNSVGRIVAGSVGSYLAFFLLSNFASWLEPALPEYQPRSLETLLLAYRNGLEFLRYQPGQLDCGLLLSLGVFGVHAYLAQTFSPRESVGVLRENA